ncbi:bifunctional riboflavin kinase/FAD synthetase [Flavobacterium sp. 7A]|uniref:bifunctional riboflavin kinase/FAD synthetase n=1 Tax=Flavobacterium sp. 7A TaxID=2940571 RepID=UPI0022271C75|nr:bifunctional riboflavin kinase/FAD synthetase [Flavobacterium sp. 7A]MCW2121121.1 riboflavin kinase/FMN adenylyltransferase [Flavobacterium sp. 7A]
MKIFHSIKDFSSTKKTILTLGTFDGVHIGHKKILDKLIQSTLSNEFESLVLTFFPHPRMVLQEKSEIKLLNTIPEKVKLLEAIGIENLVIHPFDESFSRLTAEEFVSTILVDQFRIQKIIIGHDHRFGRNRTADINDLIGFGEKYGFEVEQISVQELDSISVSSTKVRKAIVEGDMCLANNFLGYDYFFTGTVVNGRQLGRTIGFPTANINIKEDYKLIPLNGVYVIKSLLDNKIVYGIMNVGFKPTVGGEELSIEVHYLEYQGDLYGQEVVVSILNYIRPEQKFDSIDLLKNQIELDKAQALSYIQKIK